MHFAILARQRPQWRGVRIEQHPQDRREGRLRRTLLAREHDVTKSASDCTLRKDRSVSIDPPLTGIGSGFMPAARRNRTGGLSIARQPFGSISTARQVSSPRSR
jgi:hypothetical protein